MTKSYFPSEEGKDEEEDEEEDEEDCAATFSCEYSEATALSVSAALVVVVLPIFM